MEKTLIRIIEIAKKKKISQKEICKVCNLTEANFTQWKQGKTDTYRKYLPEIAKKLQVNITELLDCEENVNREITKRDELYQKYINSNEEIKKVIEILTKFDPN